MYDLPNERKYHQGSLKADQHDHDRWRNVFIHFAHGETQPGCHQGLLGRCGERMEGAKDEVVD